MDQSLEFMADIDQRFRTASGLTDRRDYSIFYSRLQPARIIVIGIKPGGSRDGTHELASHTFYENWEHEYVDKDYRIASVMRKTLVQALGATSAEELRGVAKTNSFFQRAVGVDEFTSAEMSRNVKMCAPFVLEILSFVNPDTIIFEGIAARNNVVGFHGRDVREFPNEQVKGMRRGTISSFFKREDAEFPHLGKRIELLTLGHPSHFGHLPDWPRAVSALKGRLGRDFLPPWGKSAGNEHRRTEPSSILENVEASASIHPVKRERASIPTDQRFQAATKPPASFGYSPIHDFWQELKKTGPQSPSDFLSHLNRIRWQRPSGKPLTLQVVRTDLVSMVKHGFAEREDA
jgi:hypothetical protein